MEKIYPSTFRKDKPDNSEYISLFKYFQLFCKTGSSLGSFEGKAQLDKIFNAP